MRQSYCSTLTHGCPLRRFSPPAGHTTWGTGRPSPSWPTCWRSCPSWTAGCLTPDTSGSLQSRYPWAKVTVKTLDTWKERELRFPVVKDEFLYLCTKLQKLWAVCSFDKVSSSKCVCAAAHGSRVQLFKCALHDLCEFDDSPLIWSFSRHNCFWLIYTQP